MRKLIILSVLSCCFMTTTVKAAIDSVYCAIYGPDTICYNGTSVTVRYAAKYNAGASYSWSVTGSGIQITGPRNLHYVDVVVSSTGNKRICLTYSVDGSDPCCLCKDVVVTSCGGGGGGESCCIYYVNSTYQLVNNQQVIKIKFRACSNNIVITKLFDQYGNLMDQSNWGSPINPNYTYNMNIYNANCWQIYCFKICGYTANGTECCSGYQAVILNCDQYGNPTGSADYNYPGCGSGGGGGGGIGVEKQLFNKTKLSLNPNPVSGSLLVTFPAKHTINFLQVVDRNGNVVKTYSAKNKTSITLTTSDLKTGNYFIKTDDPQIEAAPFLKQ
jgi:hypothetical protein